MAISYAPRVGEILQCNFGNHTDDNRNFNGHILPEMRKNRMVIVLNGKLGGGCLIVPISATQGVRIVEREIHVHLPENLFRSTAFYKECDRWAKADTIQHVSKKRLFKMRDGGKPFDQYLPRDVVTLVQKAVIKAIGARTLLIDI